MINRKAGLLIVSLSLSACGPLDDMKDMKNTTNELLKVSKEMNEKMVAMNAATQTMGKTTGSMADKMDATVTEMKNMRGDLKGMAGDMKGMTTDLKGMSADMKVMSERLNKTVAIMEKMDGKLGDTLKVMTGMDQKLNRTVEEMVKMGGKLEQTVSEMQKMSGKMDSMDKNLAETIKIMGSMESKLGETVAKMSLMSANLEKTVAEIQKMGGKIEAMDAKLQQTVKIMGDMDGKLENTVTEINAMGKKLDLTVAEIQKMGGKMDNMDKNLEKTIAVMNVMAGKLDQTLVVMKDMSDDAVLGLSTILINESFKHLVEKMDTFGAKLVTAGEYSSAYAFQFLKDEKDTTNAYRSDLYLSGLNMFFGHVKSVLYDGIANERPFAEMDAPSPNDEEGNKKANAYALAFRMSEVNPNQRKANRVTGMKVRTLYDVVKEGIQLHKADRTARTYNDKQEKWMQAIQNNVGVITTLMQLRYNIMMLKSLSAVSNFAQDYANMEKGKWVPKLENLYDTGVFDRTALILDAALDAHKQLKELGAKRAEIKMTAKFFGPNVTRIIQNMDIGAPANPPKNMLPALSAYTAKLKLLQNLYLADQ